MKIGVMSDSHGDYEAVAQAAAQADDVALWLHAGDLCSDAAYLAKCSGKKVISVAGNCDGLAAASPTDEFIELAGKKFWLTHGHRTHVKHDLEELLYWAEQYEVDAVIYGHTHIADIRSCGELLVLNPGSAARPRYMKATFLELAIENGNIVPKLKAISPSA